MRIIALFIIVLTAIIAVASCQNNPNIQSVNANEFEKIIANDSIQLLDVRTEAEFSKGHIHNALNINVLNDSFKNAVKQILDPDKTVAVYCRSGRRSMDAAEILAKMGFQVYNLNKGIMGWEKAGKPIEK